MYFKELAIIPPILKALEEAGYDRPTPIQQEAIPPVLEGRDLVGCAQTGTGKTAAFAIPILQRLSEQPVKSRQIRALVLTPTRELALQIYENFVQYGSHLPLRSCVIFGGVSQEPQVKALRRGVDVLIATPGRLWDLMGQGFISLAEVEIFVLDEADRMLDMGFIADVRRIAKALPARRSHRIVPHEDCLLQPELFSHIRRCVVDFINRHSISVYDEQSHKGLVRALFLRRGEVTGEVMLCLVQNGKTLPKQEAFVAELRARFPEISTILLNENTRRTNVVLGEKNVVLYGDGLLRDTLCGLRFELAAQSFYQVNHAAAQLLYERAGALCALSGHEVLVDLYCGAGTIGLSLAAEAGQVIGVDIVPEAIENARRNAALNGITNARFITADAAKAAAALTAEGLRPDVVLVDPPRKGLSPGLIDTIAEMAPERVVMVSCNSATAARDAALFMQKCYTTEQVQPVDMFSRSAHME